MKKWTLLLILAFMAGPCFAQPMSFTQVESTKPGVERLAITGGLLDGWTVAVHTKNGATIEKAAEILGTIDELSGGEEFPWYTDRKGSEAEVNAAILGEWRAKQLNWLTDLKNGAGEQFFFVKDGQMYQSTDGPLYMLAGLFTGNDKNLKAGKLPKDWSKYDNKKMSGSSCVGGYVVYFYTSDLHSGDPIEIHGPGYSAAK